MGVRLCSSTFNPSVCEHRGLESFCFSEPSLHLPGLQQDETCRDAPVLYIAICRDHRQQYSWSFLFCVPASLKPAGCCLLYKTLITQQSVYPVGEMHVNCGYLYVHLEGSIPFWGQGWAGNPGKWFIYSGGAYLNIAKIVPFIWGFVSFHNISFHTLWRDKKARIPSTGNKNIPVKHKCRWAKNKCQVKKKEVSVQREGRCRLAGAEAQRPPPGGTVWSASRMRPEDQWKWQLNKGLPLETLSPSFCRY